MIEEPKFLAILTEKGFTEREARVALLVVQGFGDKEIARTLGISEGTVRWYERRCREKLDARNRAELAAKAVDLNHEKGG